MKQDPGKVRMRTLPGYRVRHGTVEFSRVFYSARRWPTSMYT